MNSNNIRVLILDPGSASRDELAGQPEDRPHIKVVGQIAHRRQAIQLLQQLMSDLLILTLDISSVDNVETAETIMAASAVPVFVMGFRPENQWDNDYISHGMLTVLRHSSDSPLSTDVLYRKVESLVGVKVIRYIKGLHYPGEPIIPTARPTIDAVETPQDWSFVLVTACSMGELQALNKLLQDLPGTFPCPVLIAQHITDSFMKNMVHQLNNVISLKM